MSFTPEAAMRAATLDYLDLRLEDDKIITTWRHFGARHSSLDPIIEAFRARRSIYEKFPEYDVHIVIEPANGERETILPDGRIRREYQFSYNWYSMDLEDAPPLPVLKERFKNLLRIIYGELTILFDEWHDDENGMALFLEKQNKLVLDEWLIEMGYKIPSKKPKKKKSRAEKRASAAAYRAAHPECCTKSRPKLDCGHVIDDESDEQAVLGHA